MGAISEQILHCIVPLVLFAWTNYDGLLDAVKGLSVPGVSSCAVLNCAGCLETQLRNAAYTDLVGYEGQRCCVACRICHMRPQFSD